MENFLDRQLLFFFFLFSFFLFPCTLPQKPETVTEQSSNLAI